MEVVGQPITIRNVEPRDYARVLAIIDDWWAGRTMSARLSRILFEHFSSTSFVAETASGDLAGFVLGFVSQDVPGEAHVHFVGVRPDLRGGGLAAALYDDFFAAAEGLGCALVTSCTSPVNAQSIAFHRAVGFEIEPGDDQIDGIDVRRDYPLPGETRVLFVKQLVNELPMLARARRLAS